jgi:hypothetical protein
MEKETDNKRRKREKECMKEIRKARIKRENNKERKKNMVNEG